MLIRLLVYVACVTLVTASTVPPQPKCESAPQHAQPTDTNYRLSVAGDPDLFLPGELYTVSLQGVDSGKGPTPFIGFTIWAELEAVEDDDTIPPSNQSLGAFQVFDAQAKIHEFCKPAVDNATAHSKTEVQVIWSAPLKTTNTCFRLCAKATPAEGTSSWAVLARKLCAASPAPASFTRQPPIVEPCCACDEAKYEVTFEGLWSRNTHGKEFPPESARAHFGDVIGASHTAQYRVWQEGRVASSGLRRLADDGATTALEKELKAESDHIRTIIKARGISWQQVAGGVGTPSTFAVFRVDAKNHLVSLASKLAPSPDWIVGVSALELCQANCTWMTSITIPLYPYDAGTDGGISYTSHNEPTIPAAPVRALGPDWPRDVRSPFFSNNGEMRPFARLRLNRLRLYEKSCDEVGTPSIAESPPVHGSCAVHTWGAWGPCSVSCGSGRAARQRHFLHPARAAADHCRVQLTDYKTCEGPRRHCRAISEYEPDPAESTGPCAVSPWSAWSPCAGCGLRARTREYLAPRAHKRCHVGFRARTVMSQAMPCEAGPCERPPGILANSTNYDWFYVDKPNRGCPTTSWSSWSPCSARCGRGRRLRTRLYTSRHAAVQTQLSRRLLYQWNRRFAELQNLEIPPVNLTSSDIELEKLVQEHLDRCQGTLTQQEALCDEMNTKCLNATAFQEICNSPMDVGPCRSYEERWFFDVAQKSCEPFGFSGCGGNMNNFKSKDDCMQACSNVTKEDTVTTTVPSETNAKKNKPVPSISVNDVMLNDSPQQIKDVDCEVGPWLGWDSCLGDCNYAIKLNYRLLIRSPSGLGKPCPHLIKSKTCRLPNCRITSSETTDFISSDSDEE